MIRVFLVDESEILRLGITTLIQSQPGFRVVGECKSVLEAPARIAAAAVDVVVLDAHLQDGSGIELCQVVRLMRPMPRCLVFTADSARATLIAATLAGASAYVLKGAPPSSFVEALVRVSDGEQLLLAPDGATGTSRAAVPATARADPDLSLRELQVLRLITEGMTNKQIAHVLDLAEKTVKNYVSGLLVKLGLERRTQAAVYGVVHGVRRPEPATPALAPRVTDPATITEPVRHPLEP
ncbi:response regulator transcription factor [Microbacterium sp. zg.B48]|uniref:LuxR C-terminal-related transcriptional regulator n=1 Tax=Microbacterium sp. zg.B48 TaxID=2969408 RepID=UPI00214C3A95|nr:response regulator transcription factor [Microbacterium sp. zg.B48]MCR2762188.1 response regulator transcription factor [Microbacterium sp. zg.B48]